MKYSLQNTMMTYCLNYFIQNDIIVNQNGCYARFKCFLFVLSEDNDHDLTHEHSTVNFKKSFED